MSNEAENLTGGRSGIKSGAASDAVRVFGKKQSGAGAGSERSGGSDKPEKSGNAEKQQKSGKSASSEKSGRSGSGGKKSSPSAKAGSGKKSSAGKNGKASAGAGKSSKKAKAGNAKKDAKRLERSAKKKAAAEKKKNKVKLSKRIGAALKSHRAAIAAVLLIILTAAACIGIYFFTLVQRISVLGCENYTETEIINAAGLYTGRNILLYDTGAVKKQLEADPYINVIYVKRVFPNEISIKIEERSEFAAVAAGTDSYCVIDREGCILDTGRHDIEGLLPVYGLSTMGFKTGRYINEDKSLLRPYVLMELIDTIGGRSDEIAGIDLSITASLKITTQDGFTVMLGDSVDLEAKVARMFEALDRARELGSGTKIIYINSSGSADYSSGTPAPTAAPTATPESTPEELPEDTPEGGEDMP